MATTDNCVKYDIEFIKALYECKSFVVMETR